MTPHLERTVAAMQDADVEVLVLGREANARYVSGANRLWLAGSRPFSPGCVVVAATRDVHLLSVTDDGIPSAIPPDHCYPLSWNPMTMLGSVAAIPGVSAARRVGVDGMSPLFERLLGAVLPDAALVDGEALLRGVRRVKTDDDLAAIRTAVDAAEDCLDAASAAIAPGVRERDLKGVFEERMATAHGITTPAFEGTFCVVDPGAPPRTLVTERALTDGDVVHLRAGVIRHGWEGALARTRSCGDDVDVRAARAVLDEVEAAARPGDTVGDLRHVHPAVGVDGVGLGHEHVDAVDVLEPGVVLAVEVLLDGVLLGDVLAVTDEGPVRLTGSPD